MPIRVLVISDYRKFHSSRPEAEIYVSLAARGFDLTVMTYGDSPYIERLQQAGVAVIPFHPRRKWDPEAVRRIRHLVRARRIDILHLYNNLAIMNGLRAARGLPVKVVLYRGNAGNIHWYDPTAYLKFLHPRVDKIVCNARGVEAHLHRQRFFDRSKTVVINKGHQLEWYADQDPVDIRRQLQIPKPALLLVNVANNQRIKGIPYLLEAMNRLPDRADVHLLLIGADMDSRENLRIIRQGSKADRVHILGFQPKPLGIVSACDAFVLASTDHESLTMAVIEAIAVGLAPVITDIPGNRELVVHKKSGLVVPPRDPDALAGAILHLHDHRELLPRMARASQRHIRDNLSHRQTVDKMEGLYRRLVG